MHAHIEIYPSLRSFDLKHVAEVLKPINNYQRRISSGSIGKLAMLHAYNDYNTINCVRAIIDDG